MALPFRTGHSLTDSKIQLYNQVEAGGGSTTRLIDLLDQIGTLLLNIAGRRGMVFRATLEREKQSVNSQANANIIVPPPIPLPPQVTGNTAATGAGKFAYFISQFKVGSDLVYGRSGDDYRDKYVKALVPHWGLQWTADLPNMRMQPNDDMDYVIIDCYNNAFLGTEVFSTAAAWTQGGRETKKDKRKALATPITGEMQQKSMAYLGELENERAQVKNFREYLENVTEYDIQEVSAPDGLQMRYGRACKAGLAYATCVDEGKIHFVLDGITSQSVLEDLDKPKKERKITGKELRWIFRHRDDSRIKDEIVYWLDGAKTLPLWEQAEGKSAWEAYDKKVRERHPDGYKSVKAFGKG